MTEAREQEPIAEPALPPEVEPAGPTPEESVGEALSEARKALGLSLEDVAQQLKFPSRQIEALEQGRFDGLHGATFARGMVRNYARLLKLDPEPLLGRIEGRVARPAAAGSPISIRRPIPFSDSARGTNFVYVVLSLVVLAVGAAVAFEWHQDRGAKNAPLTFVPAAQAPLEPPRAVASVAGPTVAPPGPAAASSTPAASGASAPAGATLPAAGTAPTPSTAATASTAATGSTAATSSSAGTAAPTGTANAGAPPAAPSASSAPSGASSAAESAGPAAGSATASAASAGAESQSAPAAEVQPAAAHLARVVLSFAEQSWVEVKDASGKTLLSQLNPGGTEKVVEGEPPLSLVIGNAQHVTVTYQGKPIDLKPHTRVEVAHLTLN